MNLQARWLSTWRELNLPEPEPQLFGRLCDRYTESHRAYHTLQHLEECFYWFDCASGLAKSPGAVAIALWFHDAVYDPHRADNEERSAAWAVQAIERAGGSAPLRQSVYDMILATKYHAEPTSEDMRLLIDIDLSILGAPPGRFAQYEAQIRQEYGWVSDPVFCTRRTKIVEAFMARPSIFSLDLFPAQLEHQAQRNLQTSWLTLTGGKAVL
ncbi:N-methyl-D-aspartate receptor NMDAR2C subunit [Nodosilinea nodulosa]|uniref:HD domain-containing protein n=1 Tax=Nodosilinea nodulosa TaxID=416001 RepID=UPI0002E92EAB|nr:N-methyl-D-aspartate receptor NMDAR2C subunit [Nodosilinea nodulosa]